jgi:hypothetical protein
MALFFQTFLKIYLEVPVELHLIDAKLDLIAVGFTRAPASLLEPGQQRYGVNLEFGVK